MCTKQVIDFLAQKLMWQTAPQTRADLCVSLGIYSKQVVDFLAQKPVGKAAPQTCADLYVPLGIYSHRAYLQPLFASINATLLNQTIVYNGKGFLVEEPVGRRINKWRSFVEELSYEDERKLFAGLRKMGYDRAHGDQVQ
jgi:hypothetical protein